MDHHSSRRLIEDELIVAQRLVDLNLQHVQREIVFLFGQLDLDTRREAESVVVFVFRITRIGGDFPVVAIDVLPVRLQIGACKNDFARQPPAAVTLS